MYKDGEATQSGSKALVLKLQQAFSFYKITWQKAISENASLDPYIPPGKGHVTASESGGKESLV